MAATRRLVLSAWVVGMTTAVASAGPIDNGAMQWTLFTPSASLFGNMNPPAGASTSPYSGQTSPTVSLPMLPAVAPSTPLAPAPSQPPSTSVGGNLFPSLPTSASPTPPASHYDGFINLGNGPYPNAGILTTGNAQPWYNSGQIRGFFGGQPTAQQQADFSNAVLQHVQQTFQLSGVPVRLTDDPSAAASHTLSVVSNTTSSWGPLLGLTQVGTHGIDFIDQAATAAHSLDQLEWIVAHNVSHELMLAFGVGENYDKTGNFIDAPVANWSMMVNPNATFSLAASQALIADGATGFSGSSSSFGAQSIGAQSVPEPATVALWTIVAGGIFGGRTLRRKIAA